MSSGCTCVQHTPSTVMDAPVLDTPSKLAWHTPPPSDVMSHVIVSVDAEIAAESVAFVSVSSAVSLRTHLSPIASARRPRRRATRHNHPPSAAHRSCTRTCCCEDRTRG